ncbi:response regulator [Brevibacillus migulae]|uniref:response regulator n=1 Tax=Brevibacillus migulae TaxID=1644114 RepID=UPI00106E6C13|nr:response regulator [Brevibacillus migulae]
MEQPYKVLIAEDHDIQRRMLVDFCTRAKWSVVSAVSSGQQMISEYLIHRPDLILVDIHLDKSDGVSSIRSLQEKGDYPFVIFVTGSLDPDLEKLCSEIKLVDIITKPYDLPDIEKALHKAAARIKETNK